MFYANEHEPVHVHGKSQGRESKAEIIIVNGSISEIRYSNVSGRVPLEFREMQYFQEIVSVRAEEIVNKGIDFFVLNKSIYKGAKILLAGDNFGCGSSREHAPWALTGFGFQVIISTSFADIFRNNSLKNGLLPVKVDVATYNLLLELVDHEPKSEVTVDLASQTLTLPDNRKVEFPIDGFSKACLINGVDELGFIQSFESDIQKFEARPAGSVR